VDTELDTDQWTCLSNHLALITDRSPETTMYHPPFYRDDLSIVSLLISPLSVARSIRSLSLHFHDAITDGLRVKDTLIIECHVLPLFRGCGSLYGHVGTKGKEGLHRRNRWFTSQNYR
jgi:hypothetical protein